MQYIEYRFRPQEDYPEVEQEVLYDLLSDLLGGVGFDSFETTDQGELLAYIPSEEEDSPRIAQALEEYPLEGIRFTYESKSVDEVNWNEEWEKYYFQPIVLGDKLCAIRAPFHEPIEDVQIELIISPKMAFGTGNHSTTALMIEYLLEYREDYQGKRVLDMGCGTGILGILALKQGAGSLTAIDIDEWAYRNVLENASLNDVDIPDACQGDASSLEGREGYDLILANITRNILLEDMPAYVEVMSPKAKLILSGFYEEDVTMLRERGEMLGLSYLSHKSSDGGWTRLELQKN